MPEQTPEPTRTVRRTTRPIIEGTGTYAKERGTIEETEEAAAVHSVRLTVDAQGMVLPEVTAYGNTPEEAYQRAKALLERAKADGLWPTVNGGR